MIVVTEAETELLNLNGFHETIWKMNEFKRQTPKGFDIVQKSGGERWRWQCWIRTDQENPFFRGADVNKTIAGDWDAGAETLLDAIVAMEAV